MKRVLLLGLLLVVVAVPASAAHLPILASQDLAPLYSPDGRHIAYSLNVNGQGRIFDLYVVDAQTKRSAHIGRGAGSPSATWSSDGRIAWSSGGVLYEAEANGTAKKRYLAPTPSLAPAWRPHSEQLAYLTHHGAQNLDLWVAGKLWASDAIGKPAWSPDGATLAFDRDDGIYVTTGPAAERRIVTIDNPGAIAWSNDGTRLAYIAHSTLYVVEAAGGPPALKTKRVPVAAEPGWSMDDARVTADRAWSPVTADVYVQAGGRPGCPGHSVLLLHGQPLTGSCNVVGTPVADVIYGTDLWGDIISAGAGNDAVHANDRHTDRVDCGAGRDTVWADKTDRLTHCEIVHR